LEPGKLYIVSTPIGNLEDITFRAVRILKEVDFTVAEDTRRTLKLLNHFEIKSELVSCHSFNEHKKVDVILSRIKNGESAAFVSDAGTPGISDPGFLMVREALKLDIEPVIIPGVSALTFSACASGVPIDRFAFYGFPPAKKGKREKFFAEIAEKEMTAIVFESPYRISKSLEEIKNQCGAEAQIAIVREATKLHEEVLRGSAEELAEKFKKAKSKGEFVIVISK
jgi:16S rRNA (cytidine1402-2'-O)-methyltransferase